MAVIHNHDDDDAHDDFGGLQRDLLSIMGRRSALQLIGGAGLAAVLAACGSSSPTNAVGGSTALSATPTLAPPVATVPAPTVAQATALPTLAASPTSAAAPTQTAAPVAANAAGAEIPNETGGPYPADGTNGPNVLTEAGIVRSDITTSFGSLSGTADGVPLNIQLTVVDATTGTPMVGAAVYLWSCTADGSYSIYQVEDQNYLRGVQISDASGVVTFTSIFPGCYSGRWPHCHFEIYDVAAEATSGREATKTSQLALPEAACQEVYADSRYTASVGNLSQLSLAEDNVFRDGWELQLATIVGLGTPAATASLLVRI